MRAGLAMVAAFDNRPGVSADAPAHWPDLTKINNAPKFTNGGQMELSISTGELNGVRCVEFAINDTGFGLSDEPQGRLFRPFVQADMAIARRSRGTGLGLALVWRFCRLMEGAVRVESRPNTRLEAAKTRY